MSWSQFRQLQRGNAKGIDESNMFIFLSCSVSLRGRRPPDQGVHVRETPLRACRRQVISMNALIYVQLSGMPLILTCQRQVRIRRAWRSGVRARRAVPLRRPGLTFVSFGYKRNGFASFATKRSIKISLQKYS